MEKENNSGDLGISEAQRRFEEANNQRVQIIKREFEEGFKFLGNNPRSVTIFGSSQFREGNQYYDHARTLGQKIVKELGYAVLTGGGPGIMEAANRGAYEAGGPSLGLTIELPEAQPTNKYLTDKIEFYYFFSRKVCLSFAAEAYIFYPGGFGTLDEFFEIVTLVQTKKITPVPIILPGKKYWNGLDKLVKKQLLKRFKTIDLEDTSIYKITDDFDEILKIIKEAPIRDGIGK